ncbi:aminotransferase class V-fold PLP-dependent enzyme [Persicobacter diffluens]|uniref:Aminotransferase n=1 Tax=Persicobacter diffluens TaxID=981 RepID=A0AAN4VYN2_9BACT|nr:aminotransferase [Persicobacter diffluens]
MISFYPGPSAVYPEIPLYVQQAYDEGILSMNHRSPEFIAISKELQKVIKEKLEIPQDYMVMYCSSATECWENIAQSFRSKKSLHFYNGAFGEKWANYQKLLLGNENVIEAPFGIEEAPALEKFTNAQADLLCLTQCETSNATQLPEGTLEQARSLYPEALVTIDATSALAGVQLPIALGDIWYASVQKCFGLPAGMAVIILSPKAQQLALANFEAAHYNHLGSMIRQMEAFQTPYTPNVLNIYLLLRTLQAAPPIGITSQRIRAQWQNWKTFLAQKGLKLLIKNEAVQSETVLAIQASPQKVTEIKQKAKAQGILLGNGYGKWKDDCFRIANFPAIPPEHIQKLITFLEQL